MDRAAHYRKAEELAAKAEEYLGQGDGQESAAVWAAVAQVHATLALAAAALEPPRASYAPSPKPAAPDVPFIPKPTTVELGGAYNDPQEHGSLAPQADRVAPAHLPQRDGVPQIPGTDSGSLMADQPLSAPWQHVPSRTARDLNADTASRSGAQPPDTAHDAGE